ncbi:MAG: EamA family transporter, partial [Rhodothermales bacterium]
SLSISATSRHVVTPATTSRLKLLAAFATLYVVWGSTYLAIAIAVESIPPFLAIGSRFFMAGTVLYAFLRLRGRTHPSRPQLINAAMIGFFTLGVGTGMVAWAEQFIDSGFVALLITSLPLWFVLLDWFMLKGGAPNGYVVLGLVLGLVGIVILTGPTLKSGLGDTHALAVVLVLIGTLSWSAGSLRSKQITMPPNAFMSSAIQMTFGGLMVGLIGLLLGEWGTLDWHALTIESLWAWAYLVVFGSFGAFSAYVWLLDKAPPKQISSYAFVNPVVAVFLGWWLADELVTPRILLACVVMVVAVALIVVHGGKPGKPQSGQRSA